MRVFVPLIFVFLTLVSCAARINGSVSADGSAAFSVDMSMGPRMVSLIRSLNSAGGQDSDIVLDGPAIAQSMSMEGISSVSFKNTAPAAVQGDIRVSNVNRFLSEGDKAGFIIFEQHSSGGSCRININLDNGPVILESLSPEISDYLNALMAPIATGENLSKNEYLDLVASFYNRAISSEISGSRISAFIDFPGAISDVKGGTFTGRRAVFDISLLDFLVLDTPLNYEVTWN